MEQKKVKTTSGLDIAGMQRKWGVTAEEIHAAIANVGSDRSQIEEYLVNHRWQKKDNEQHSFEKRELNEDETY